MCSKIGCKEPSAALLLIAPADCQAWLVPTDHPSGREGVALCDTHAERVSVPKGWQFDDERALSKSTKRRRKKAKAKDSTKAKDNDKEKGHKDKDTGKATTPKAKKPVVVEPELDDAPAELPLEDAVVAPPTVEDDAVEDDVFDDDTPTIVNEALVIPAPADEPILADSEPTRELTITVPGDPGQAAAEAGRHLRQPESPDEQESDAEAEAAPTGRDAVVADTSKGEPAGQTADSPSLSVVPPAEDELPFEDAVRVQTDPNETGSHLITNDSTPLLKRAFRVVEEG